MRKDEIEVGGLYWAKVSDKVVTVRIDSSHSNGGWNATNTATGKTIRIKNGQRLRGAVKDGVKTGGDATAAAGADGKKVEARPKATTQEAKAVSKKKPKRVSATDAAAQVLAKAGKPMQAKELIAAMAERGLWMSPAGKTPHATLYAAMLRESRDKGAASRFKKVDRGRFAFNEEAK